MVKQFLKHNYQSSKHRKLLTGDFETDDDFSFTAPGWVPPLEAAVEWLDAYTAIQPNKKAGWMPTQQYKQKNWLDANTAIQPNKKTGWMPTQQYNYKRGT